MTVPLRISISAFCTAAFAFTGAAQTPEAATGGKMKAVVYHEYGSPDVLRIEELDKPVPNDNQLLVRVRAASVNPLDWHYMEGTPYVVRPLDFGLLSPKSPRLGVDYSGTVEAVGRNVKEFKVGDDVFGAKTGAFAEYVCVLADRAVTLKPSNVTFEQAASVPIAGLTALQGLRDKGKVQPGQKVLINGASGGVGTFAVQIAKVLGAQVTAVCSTRNVDMVRGLGADRVVDYAKEDFTGGAERYDVILDNVGNHSLSKCRRVLAPDGKYVLVGGGGLNDGRWIGPMVRPIKALLFSAFVRQDMGMMLASLTKQDLATMAELMQASKVTPVIDRTYSLGRIADAIRYLEEGHARGKVAITVEPPIALEPTAAGAAIASENAMRPVPIALVLLAVAFAVSLLPILLALVLNRRFRRQNPGKKSYRWGYYFAIVSVIGAILFGIILEAQISGIIIGGFIYAVLAWFFGRRHRWAWIALTVFSFNPIAWIINSIYLWKRWTEDSPAITAS